MKNSVFFKIFTQTRMLMVGLNNFRRVQLLLLSYSHGNRTKTKGMQKIKTKFFDNHRGGINAGRLPARPKLFARPKLKMISKKIRQINLI